ncbi:unnamed protein product, partial [Amoebophrya sp. A25]
VETINYLDNWIGKRASFCASWCSTSRPDPHRHPERGCRKRNSIVSARQAKWKRSRQRTGIRQSWSCLAATDNS